MTKTSVQNDLSALIRAAQTLDELYPVLNSSRYTAGWHKKRPSLWGFPRPAFEPQVWRYAEGKLALDRAGEWIGTELAERRNLLMFNPCGDNDYATTTTLVCAYQMIKPGEYAWPHRHTPNALRLVLDAEPGVVTVVNGIKLPMMPGDVALTPGWMWHSHYNEGKTNAYWIDFLDVPLVHRLEPMFYERYPEELQEIQSEPKESEFVFTLEWARGELPKQPAEPGGVRRLLLPKNTMKTMDLYFIAFPQHATTGQYRTTASSIFAAVEGSGVVRFESREETWKRGDVFAVPAWNPYEIEAADDALLFQVTDEPVLQMLGFHHEKKG